MFNLLELKEIIMSDDDKKIVCRDAFLKAREDQDIWGDIESLIAFGNEMSVSIYKYLDAGEAGTITDGIYRLQNNGSEKDCARKNHHRKYISYDELLMHNPVDKEALIILLQDKDVLEDFNLSEKIITHLAVLSHLTDDKELARTILSLRQTDEIFLSESYDDRCILSGDFTITPANNY